MPEDDQSHVEKSGIPPCWTPSAEDTSHRDLAPERGAVRDFGTQMESKRIDRIATLVYNSKNLALW